MLGDRRIAGVGGRAVERRAAARTDGGVSLFTVVADADGLTRTALSTMDQTRKLAQLEFAVTPARLLGPGGRGWAGCRPCSTWPRSGWPPRRWAAPRCLEMAVEYAKVRMQFGRPIGSFQAIKHQCADMLVEVESARSAAYYGMGARPRERRAALGGPLAKAYCSEAYCPAAAENIQMHGGIGFTWEHAAHLYFKRAKTSEMLFGDPDLPPGAVGTAHWHLNRTSRASLARPDGPRGTTAPSASNATATRWR